MSPANLDRFAERLRRLLVERGLTQTELAAKTGIDRVDLNRMANGKREPKPAELAFLAKVLRVEPEELLEGLDTAEVRMYAVWAERVIDAEAIVGEIRSQLESREAAHRAAEARWVAERDELLQARQEVLIDCSAKIADAEAAAAKLQAAHERDLRAMRDQLAAAQELVKQFEARLTAQARSIEQHRGEVAKQAGREMFAGLVGAAIGAIISSNNNDH